MFTAIGEALSKCAFLAHTTQGAWSFLFDRNTGETGVRNISCAPVQNLSCAFVSEIEKDKEIHFLGYLGSTQTNTLCEY